MYASGRALKTDADFDNAVLFGLRIEVYQHGEPLDPGGTIESHSEEAVKIDGAYFLKSNCEFIVRY
jgi:hypothetical protein